MLQTGYAKLDITPALGDFLEGYFEERPMDGVIDPLYAIAVVFANETERAALITLDTCYFLQETSDELRRAVSEACGLPFEAVFLQATHTHQGACIGEKNPAYTAFLTKRLIDLVNLATEDLAPTELYATRGRVEGVSFIRRFRMKDGAVQTNPGLQNPNILAPLGDADEESQLLVLKREGKDEIGIINFQVHPDVIGGCKCSADYPKFVRETYEALVENSRCIYINGAQGDTNHVDVRLSADDLVEGYERSAYMGRKIAMSVACNRPLVSRISGEKIAYGQKNVTVFYNKGKPEELDAAIARYKVYCEQGLDAATPEFEGMRKIEVVSEAERMVLLMDKPDTTEVYVTALSVGDAAFLGWAGEPFTAMGVSVKENSPFALTMPACCANGYTAYFPTAQAFSEGGYEVVSTDFAEGSAEALVSGALELLGSF